MPFLFPAFGFALLLRLVALGVNIWMLVDAVRRPEAEFNPPAARVWWIVALAVGIVLSWVGLAVSLVYYFLVRKPVSEGRPAAQLFGASAGPPGRAGRTCSTCGDPLGTHARFCQRCGTQAGSESK